MFRTNVLMGKSCFGVTVHHWQFYTAVTTLCLIHAAGTAARFTGQSSRTHAQRVRLRTRGQGSVEGTWRVMRFQLQCRAVPSRRYTCQQHQNIVFLFVETPNVRGRGLPYSGHAGKNVVCHVALRSHRTTLIRVLEISIVRIHLETAAQKHAVFNSTGNIRF